MTTNFNLTFTQMVKKLLFYFMLTIPVIANASDWYFINDRNSEGLTFFDKESHSSSNGEVTLWLQKIKLDDENDNAYSSKQKIKVSCKSKTIQILNLVNYNNKGITTYRSSSIGKLIDVVPDSIGDFLLKIVCKSDFPNGKNTDDYFSVENPIEATQKIKAELSKISK